MAKKPTTSAGSKIAKPAKKGASDGGFLGRAVADDEPLQRPEVKNALPIPVPIPLSRVLGQDRAVATLQNALESGRIHHAWIFHGPTGVGKFTTALAFAAMILDPTTARGLSGEWAADPESKVQTLIKAGMHPDLHIVTKELALFSEESRVRESKQRTIAKEVVEEHLLKPVNLAPLMRSGAKVSKVFIVDEAELLDRSLSNAPVQNSLLKTLEEPPEGTVIILVTSSEEMLLPTIRSRSQRVGFTPLPPDAMKEWAKSAAVRDGMPIAADERDWLLSFAAGAPGVFVSARDGGLFTWHALLSPMLGKLVQGKYDIAMAPTMAKLIDEYAEAWVKAHKNASKEAANHDAAEWLFRLLGEYFRGVLRSAAMGGQKTPEANERLDRLALAMDLIEEAQRRLHANIGAAAVFEGFVADAVGVFSGDAIGA